MRNWILIFTSSLSLLFVGFAGCTGDDAATPTSASSTSVGAGGDNPCNNSAPNGFCNSMGNDPETCACADCASSAVCTAACTDDGQCDSGAGEDCTCTDCYMKVDGCPPEDVGCYDNAECNTDEDCVCNDCTGTPRCTDNCLDNGSCVRYLEGCSCADCAPLMVCGGSGSTTTASSSTAAGGSGGTGGMPATTGTGASGGMGGTGIGTGGSGGTGG
jgi:hypothetical protein